MSSIWMKRNFFLLATIISWFIFCLPQNIYTLLIYFHPENQTETSFQNSTNKTQANYSCFDGHDLLKNKLDFGIRGVAVTVVGTFGIITNSFSIILLQKLAAKSGFNRLLLSLGTYYFKRYIFKPLYSKVTKIISGFH